MSAVSDNPIQDETGSGTGVVKRRACDECRTRKLACTKETDGCTRCKREGVACNYSVQKQMGRPKKRRIAEEAPEVPPVAPAAPVHAFVTAEEEPIVAMPDAVMDIDPASFIDPSLDAADTSFLDLFGPDFISTQPLQAETLNPKGYPINEEILRFNINFDSHYPPPSADSTESTSTQFPAPGGLSTPSLSSQGASPPEIQQPPEHVDIPAALPPGSCGCLASLYLALDSLTRLPTEAGPAIRVARTASKAAHNTIQCRACSPPLTETMKVPIATFQNFTILGVLMPSIVDAYQRILDMVEAETARAICEQRELNFTLPDYGGFWGQLESTKEGCGAASRYCNVAMKPAMWRLTVRALLKADVYGMNLNVGSPGGEGLHPAYLGLKDIINLMDERSRMRHAEVDALVEAGLAPPTGPTCLPMPRGHAHDGDEEPYCRRFIRMARDAVDRLVIP